MAGATFYIHACFTLGGGLVWQTAVWNDEPAVRIALHVASGWEHVQRRKAFKAAASLVAGVSAREPDEFTWLALGKRVWKVDAKLLRARFEFVRDLDWLGDGVIEVEPDFETYETEAFGGRPSYKGSICLYITPEMVGPPALDSEDRLRVLVFHGPDNDARDALLAWLNGADISADARTVGQMPANAEGSVNDRVARGIAWAEKLIAIVSPDDRSPSGAPNVIEEIGRSLGAQRAADLVIVRHRACADIWSNLAGVVRLEYDDRIKEAFLGIAKSIGALRAGRPED